MKTPLLLLVVLMLCSCENGFQLGGSGSGPSATNRRTAHDPTTSIQTLAENRDLAKSTAEQVKSNWPSNGAEYTKARSLYNIAKAKNSGFLEALSYALRQGTPLNTQQFHEKAEEAVKSTEAFVNFVNSNPPQQRSAARPKSVAAAVVVAGTLVNAGWKVFDAYKTRTKADRVERADYVKSTLAWPEWEKT